MLDYDPNQSWQTNISELHGSQFDRLSRHIHRADAISAKQRPDNEKQRTQMADEMVRLAKHSDASFRGRIYYDPRELSGADPRRQRAGSRKRASGA